MKKLMLMVCFGVACTVSLPSMAGNQQEKMKGCNAEAKEGGMKGDERKAFMSKCLKKDYVLKSQGGGAAAAPEKTEGGASLQQDKMKSCSADAKSKGLKGDERKSFMSSCLKG